MTEKQLSCTTSSFGNEPRWELSNVSANIAIAIFTLKIILNIRRGSFPKAELVH
jgi:hypothetical protein